MALLFFDGFDGYDSGDDLFNYGKWLAGVAATTNLSSSTRTGVGKALNLINYSNTVPLFYASFANKFGIDTFFGTAIAMSSTFVSGTYIVFNNGTSEQCSLWVEAQSSTTFKLAAYRGATRVALGSTILTSGVWYSIEVKVNVHTTTGVFDCKISGITEFTFSGNTSNSGTAFDRFSITAPAGTGANWATITIDDLYFCDSSGSLNNTYLGEVLCRQLPPTADVTAGFSRNAGASNYLAIDDVLGAPDDATTYVYSSVVTTRDEYALTDVGSTDIIYGVKVNTRAQKDAVNPKSFKHGIKTGANQQSSANILLTQGYLNYQDIYESSDGAGTAWTPTTLNAAVSFLEVL